MEFPVATPPEIELHIESVEITAHARKLRAVWSYEAEQDLRSIHNLEALALEISREIDEEILEDLRSYGGATRCCDKINWKKEGF